jgi:GNAT superfamily N-acetyltransferase
VPSAEPPNRFGEITYELDEELTRYDVYGPGRWVEGRRVRAMLDGQIVGTLILNDRGIHMLLNVRPDLQRLGVASAMFYAAKDAGWHPTRGATDVSPAAKAWADTLDWS